MIEPTTDRGSVSHITDDMVEAAARELYGGPVHRTKVVDGEIVEYTVTWDENDDSGHFGRDIYRRQARRVLAAALAGYTPVRLPEQTANDEDDDPAWVIPGGGQIVACVIEGQPFVVSDPPSFRPLADRVEKYALRLLAAAREARRLAAEVSRDDT